MSRATELVTALSITVVGAVVSVGAVAVVVMPPASSASTIDEDAYANAIREHVVVSNGRDDDGDGIEDEFSMDIIRPDTDEPVPVIMMQSPYWDALGRGRESEVRVRDGDGVISTMPLAYDNWFVPRGYAVVALDAPGIAPGAGCNDNFGPATVGVATAALDWLSGTGDAVDQDGSAVDADWSSGSVAMLGKSADGGYAVAAAATGHEALDAIVPISAPTSMLSLNTVGGVQQGHVPTPDWYGASCTDFGAAFIDDWGDGHTYTDFWAERDPAADMSAYSGATLLAAGLHDLNVPTAQASMLWDALGEADLPRQLWLHQAGHSDPFDVDREAWVATLTGFLEDALVTGDPIEESATVQATDGSWSQLDAWPPPASETSWAWDGEALAEGTTAEDALAPIGSVVREDDDPLPPDGGYIDHWLGDPEADEPFRLVLASGELTEAMTISGAPTITASFQQTGARYGIAATLIDLGEAERIDPDAALTGAELVDAGSESCWGQSSETDDACYADTAFDVGPTDFGIVASGASGIERATVRDEIEPVQDGEWTTATIDLGMANATIPEGHQVAVVLTVAAPAAFEDPQPREVVVGSDIVVSLPVADEAG